MKVELKEFDVADFLTNDEIRKEYFTQILADGDLDELRHAIFDLARSRGVENVAKKANLNRESFYKMFRPEAKPRFESIFRVMQALDIKLACV